MKLAIFKKFWFKKKEIHFILKPESEPIIDNSIEIINQVSSLESNDELVLNDNKSLMLDSKIKIKIKSLMIGSLIYLWPYRTKLNDSKVLLNKLFRNEFDREIRFVIISRNFINSETPEDSNLYLNVMVTLFFEQKHFNISITCAKFQDIVNSYFELKDDVQFYNIKISPIKYYKLVEKLKKVEINEIELLKL